MRKKFNNSQSGTNDLMISEEKKLNSRALQGTVW